MVYRMVSRCFYQDLQTRWYGCSFSLQSIIMAIPKVKFKVSGTILKMGAYQYRMRGIRYSVLARRAISKNQEFKAQAYASMAVANLNRCLMIEARMLRHLRPIIRTVDSDGSFKYHRLVSGELKPTS